MNPIKIFSGSFGGQTLYENPFYVSPNLVSILYPITRFKINKFMGVSAFAHWCISKRSHLDEVRQNVPHHKVCSFKSTFSTVCFLELHTLQIVTEL